MVEYRSNWFEEMFLGRINSRLPCSWLGRLIYALLLALGRYRRSYQLRLA